MGLKEMAQKAAESRAAGGGNWIRQGKGTLIVSKLIAGGKEKDPAEPWRPVFYGGDTFLAELYVERSEDIPGAKKTAPDGKTESAEPETANPPGTTLSFGQYFYGDTEDVAGPNTKAFLCALLDEDPGAVSTTEFVQAMQHTTGKDNPCRGMRIGYETYIKVSQKKKNRLVLVKWMPVKGQNAETIAEGIAVMEGRKAA